MLIFVLIVLTIWLAGNYYVFIRGWQALPDIRIVKTIYASVFIFCALSYIFYRVLERQWLSPVTDTAGWIGSLWFGALLYFFLMVVLFDILRLVNHWFPFYPGWVRENYQAFKWYLFLGSLTIVMLVLIIGFVNNFYPKVRKVSITIPALSGETGTLRIVVASDIHLCPIMGPGKAEKLASLINSQNPDVVFLAGDILDENPVPVIHYKIGEPLRKISAPLGVYAITGNHEYIGGAADACKYIESLGIILLRDSVVKPGNRFWLIGREDKDITRFSGKERKSLTELVAQTDSTLPVFLMDHQPFKLDESQKAGIALQVSGHTHHGQLWPLNYITSAIYELSYGYLRKGNSHFVVSSGYGLWGPPVRTVNRPEIVLIEVELK